MLEGYRGLAAVLIVVYHVYQFMRSGPDAHYPYVGTPWHVALVGLDSFVGLFFVLSAFLLGLPYARAALAGERPTSARTFLFRRTVRIVPLYLVVVLVVWAARNRTLPGDWLELVEHLTFTQVFDNKRIFYTIGPAWSLAVEVHFYVLLALLAPAAVALCHKVTGPRRRVAVLFALALVPGAVGVAWKTLAWYRWHVSEQNWWVWFSLPAKLDLFAVGLLLACVVAVIGRQATAARAVRVALLVLGLLVVATAFVLRDRAAAANLYFHSVTAVGFGCVLAASILAGPSGTGRVLGRPMPARLGMISYSLYLWHEPVMLFLASRHLFPVPGSAVGFPLGVLILVPAAVLVAWCSYWVIEYPTGLLRHAGRGPETATAERAGRG